MANVSKDPSYKQIRTGKKIQREKALSLLKNANVTILGKGAGIPKLKNIQEYLTDYKITVYQYGSKGRNIIYKGTGIGPSLNLIYHEGHFNVIHR